MLKDNNEDFHMLFRNHLRLMSSVAMLLPARHPSRIVRRAKVCWRATASFRGMQSCVPCEMRAHLERQGKLTRSWCAALAVAEVNDTMLDDKELECAEELEQESNAILVFVAARSGVFMTLALSILSGMAPVFGLCRCSGFSLCCLVLARRGLLECICSFHDVQ